MPDLESQIAAWRETTIKALGENHALVDELEDHLREHLATLRAGGVPDERAITQAIARVGDPATIATQLVRLCRPRWRFVAATILRLLVTIAFGSYLLAMGLQVIGVSLAVFKDLAGIEADNAGAKAAFFPNMLVCAVCVTVIWATWRVKGASRPTPRTTD